MQEADRKLRDILSELDKVISTEERIDNMVEEHEKMKSHDSKPNLSTTIPACFVRRWIIGQPTVGKKAEDFSSPPEIAEAPGLLATPEESLRTEKEDRVIIQNQAQ
ncbi:hypothetical protein OESDEN_02693 [Oesophagostomum dentatum]|uniref:Uncharacterized protein n=1 Tax=Oesophagostomum dentatum TaxID=61180 RepID=A0A0B1TNB4_OESDE|nr:hypothetical protein OESDEN_02693 [Oesophagostomum dentatum]